MADENKPAFYPRVGNIKAKNFVSAQPMPFIDDPRAMELPRFGEDSDQFGRVDVGVASQQNLELGRRMVERENQLRRQREADRSIPEKLAGGIQAGRFLGSALTQSINAIPIQLFSEGTAAEREKKADKFIQDRIYKPEQPLAYEYAQDVGDFLEKLETEYKIPPVLPESLPLAFLTVPATAQAARAAGKGAVKAGMALERSMEPVVKGALERGGLPREMVMAMGANTQSNVVKPKGGNWFDDTLNRSVQDLKKTDRGVPFSDEDVTYLESEIERLRSGNLQNQMVRENIRRLQGDLAMNKQESALNNWLDNTYKNYVKNEMATPEDRVRKMFDRRSEDVEKLEAKYEKDITKLETKLANAKAQPQSRERDQAIAYLERDIENKIQDLDFDVNTAEKTIAHIRDLEQEARYPQHGVISVREDRGFPTEGMATSTIGKGWENLTDSLLGMKKAGRIGKLPETEERYPWLESVDPEAMVYKTLSGLTTNTGIDHVLDILRQDLRSGALTPEQLKKITMDQAVERAANADREAAVKMRSAQVKNTEGFPTYKEYDGGFKWIELSPIKTLPEGYTLEPNKGWNKSTYPYRVIGREGEELFGATSEADAAKTLVANTKKLEDALKYEGETMGHCVGGYCPDVLQGRSRIFSLRDRRGEPHVTVEVTPVEKHPISYAMSGGQKFPDDFRYESGNFTPEQHQQIYQRAKQLFNPQSTTDVSNHRMDAFQQAADEVIGKPADEIAQIKGKQNARPIGKYDQYTQDFVKSGNWSAVGDLKNTGLIDITKSAIPWPEGTKAEQIDRLVGGMQDGTKTPMYKSNQEFFKKAQEELGSKFVSEQEYKDWLAKQINPDIPPLGMKRGGKVSISNNPDTMMLEVNNQKMKNGVPAYAGGKLIMGKGLKAAKPPKLEVPIRFPVSRGPSVPEIRAMAERMAPQVMGEFVRAAPTPSNPKPSTSVTGKTQKQFEREKTLPIEYQNIKEPVTPEEFDYAQKKGALLIGAQGDVTPGNRMLMSIDEQPLSVPVHLQAGPEWELYNPSAWAASDQMAKTYMNRADKAAEAYNADPYLHYHKMTPDANFYAMHHLNSVLGHLRPEELMLRDPKLYQQMVEEIRTRDVGFGKHPEFEGFEDPLNLQIHAQMDPNFRRHLSAIFDGPRFTERYGLNSGQDVMAATSLPELRDLEAGASGYAVVPLDVKAPLKHFEAESQTYDTGFPKAGASGRSKYPSPYQLIYRDTLNWMKDNPSEKKSSEFGRMNMIVPKQQIDNELIEAIGEYQRRMKELTGKKKGGAVKKEGGYLKKPAAYINGDEFVNAAKKYGIKDSMNNLNKIVDLVNKGLSVDDAAQQVADSGMHKAAGGAISGDDLILEERPL
jgi:hypothetical protein